MGEGYDSEGIAQVLEVYEVEFDEDGDEVGREKIDIVVTPGREYSCPVCYATFPHPASELAVCKCGQVVAEPDPAPEDEDEED